MPRISKKQLYEDERKILLELKNPKVTIAEIASKLHFSKQKIYRVQKKYHMDDGFNPEINNHLEMRRFFILVSRNEKSMPKDMFHSTFEKMIKNNVDTLDVNIHFEYNTNGSSDWLFCISVSSLWSMEQFCMLIQNVFGEYIKKIDHVELISPIEEGLGLSFDPLERLRMHSKDSLLI